jgi:pseudaminic acid cytidylyltransferase|tara:strand:- start:273 stop:959 length:687 start_codon:yes stop_codon:yes gene_type:complete
MNLAIIPARAGSKRIKNKNIVNFFGKPLIYNSIKIAIKSKLFDDVIVSTDSIKIQKIALKYGAKVYFKRPKSLSGDHTGTPSVINHAIKWVQKNLYNPIYVCCIYPTAVSLNETDIINAYKKIKTNKFNFVFPVNKYSHPPQRGFNLTSDNRINFKNFKFYKVRTQDLKPMYHDAGQFYWGKTSSWLLKKSGFTKNSCVTVMSNFKSIDIDNKEDLEFAKKIHSLKKK